MASSRGGEPIDPAEPVQGWSKSLEAQRLRLRRFRLATLSYLLFLGELWAIQLTGFNITPPVAAAAITGGVIVVNIGLYVAFRFRLNLRLADPSLTAIQVVMGFTFGLAALGLTGTTAAQDVYLITATIPMLYGMLRLRTRELTAVAAAVIAAFVLILTVHRLVLVRPELLRFDILRVVAFAAVLLWVSWLGGYIGRLRARLAARNEDLRHALAHNRRLAAEDELTALSTRRVILGRIGNLLETREPFTLALADLDQFKAVNDTLGHPAGDRVLRVAAQRMSGNIRPGDEIGRYGGDEFLILMPRTDLDTAQRVAERLRAAIAAEPLVIGNETIALTVSIGIGANEGEDDLDTVLSRVDRALYRAKALGRDRVTRFVSDPEG